MNNSEYSLRLVRGQPFNEIPSRINESVQTFLVAVLRMRLYGGTMKADQV